MGTADDPCGSEAAVAGAAANVRVESGRDRQVRRSGHCQRGEPGESDRSIRKAELELVGDLLGIINESRKPPIQNDFSSLLFPLDDQ